ncbi:glycosyltransferase family 4 protein [Runella salmonicolor]|uniref:Glycosyltransferase family 4 protein n=1 Tax=Runella salmonicolor TaxID=2950278 RepID=A0ABT1FJW0_9BACT|nr:glycosyltransferase family 4 protein [Runella salmonicolor]MCP1382041.1 glycosyltransferase family 4 protein [Runella salmonicolor]
MNILITAPSLDVKKNVSGVATVVNTIIEHNCLHKYFHYLLGRPDSPMGKLKWFYTILEQLFIFPFFVKKNEIQLVHQNLPFNTKGLLRESIINFWCYLVRVPVLLHVHGGVYLMNPPENLFYRFIAKQLFRHSKVVVVLSGLENEAIAKHYNFRDSLVLLNSIDSSLYSAISKNKDDHKPVLLFMGRIHESKGIEDIVAAFRILKQELNFRFVLCGDGPLRAYCVDECQELLGDDFEYRGVVSGNDKMKAIADSDFFLLPSRYGEGLPMALLETMAAGVVPVVTNDASMAYIIEHEVNGLMVNKFDALDLYKKLKRILSDTMLYNVLSINASKTIKDKYDVNEYIENLNIIYKQIK